MTDTTSRDWRALLDDGHVALPDALAAVEDVTRRDGSRLIVLRLAGGLSIDVLPDRGLDLGSAWWGDTPISWRSPHPVDPGPGRTWEDRFLGGLLATCGPDNIGPPRGTSGQHGTHHSTPAYDVRWWREPTDSGIGVHIRGAIAHTTLDGPRIVIEREIVAGTGRPSVEVRDTVRNVGDHATGVPLLYHVNLGAPVLAPGARLEIDADRSVTRDPLPPGRDPLLTPPPHPGLEPVVADHMVTRTDSGTARATLHGAGANVVVDWSLNSLPRLFTWSWPAAGAYVLGVEPANAPQFGPERQGPHAGAPVLEPGAQWHTRVRIEIEPRRNDEAEET